MTQSSCYATYKGLLRYISEKAYNEIYTVLNAIPIFLEIKRSRKTKLGDFRPPNSRDDRYRISINGDLSEYEFLMTLLHEIAHAQVWKQYANKVQPHGVEWKKQYGWWLNKMLSLEIFPPDIAKEITRYAKNPAASSRVDIKLALALKVSNSDDSPVVLLQDLPEGATFELNGRRFVKNEKRRTRYFCQCLENQRTYVVNAITEVNPIKPVQTEV